MNTTRVINHIKTSKIFCISELFVKAELTIH